MSGIGYDLDRPLDELLEVARAKFGEVVFEDVAIGELALKILQIKDMPAYIDTLVARAKPGQTVDLPLWAKVWPSCLFLGLYLQQGVLGGAESVLELGAGVAVIGLVAAKVGYDVTVTDIEDDALLFARINALANDVGEKMTIAKVDFTKDSLGKSFDSIIGCEVLYNENSYVAVAGFVDHHLSAKNGAEVLLAMDQKRKGKAFFNAAKDKFVFMRKQFNFSNDESGEKQAIDIYRMRRG